MEQMEQEIADVQVESEVKWHFEKRGFWSLNFFLKISTICLLFAAGLEKKLPTPPTLSTKFHGDILI